MKVNERCLKGVEVPDCVFKTRIINGWLRLVVRVSVVAPREASNQRSMNPGGLLSATARPVNI